MTAYAAPYGAPAATCPVRCVQSAPPTDLTRTINLAAEIVDVQEEPLRVAVSAMTSPKETLVTHHELLHYIGEKVDRRFAWSSAAPQVDGEAVYYSYLLVPAYSKAYSLAGLRGGTFAFTDPLSSTGHLIPGYWLWELGTTPEEFFAKQIFTYSHERAVLSVADGLVDGAAVDYLVYQAMLNEMLALGVSGYVLNGRSTANSSRPFGSFCAARCSSTPP